MDLKKVTLHNAGYIPGVSIFSGLIRFGRGVVRCFSSKVDQKVHKVALSKFKNKEYIQEREGHHIQNCLKDMGRGLIEMIPIIGNISVIVFDILRPPTVNPPPIIAQPPKEKEEMDAEPVIESKPEVARERIHYSPAEFKKSLKRLEEGYQFPADKEIFIEGTLDFANKSNLAALLPEGLHVRGGLYLNRCTSLTSLPEGLQVRGDLDLVHCISLTTLPEGLHVGGSLSLERCTSLTTLPEGLHVGGYLILHGSTSLTTLPEGLHVGGGLSLAGCTSLTSLPEGLYVGGGLNLSGCTSLTTLPEGLHVEGGLDLGYCTSLTALPNWITTLGLTANGLVRVIILSGTGLSEEVIRRLQEAEAPGIQFHFSQQGQEPIQQFRSLHEALKFWEGEAGRELEGEATIDLHQDEVIRFLARLTETADYKNVQSRKVLAGRIIDLFELMLKDEGIKERGVDVIFHGLASCDDRIISALDETELMVQIYQIEHGEHSEEELRELAKGFYFFDEVNKQAAEHVKTLNWVDEIEVYLAFQIGLAERFHLPMKTKNMIFGSCAQVSDKQIAEAGDRIEKSFNEEKFQTFLQSWSPWVEHQRQKGIPTYDQLETVNQQLPEDTVCPVTQDYPEQPVLYNNTIYDYDGFIGFFKANGKDPMNRNENVDLTKLKRIKFEERK